MIAEFAARDDLRPRHALGVIPGRERFVTQRVIDYIEENYTAGISLRDVARALGYSPCHLTNTFRQSTGTPVTAWIIRRRISAAQRLLGESNVSVAKACEEVGFNDLCYFTRQFVRYVGVTPGRFRAAVKRENHGEKQRAQHVG